MLIYPWGLSIHSGPFLPILYNRVSSPLFGGREFPCFGRFLPIVDLVVKLEEHVQQDDVILKPNLP